MPKDQEKKPLTAPVLIECGMERSITPAGYDLYTVRAPMGFCLNYESWSYRWYVNGDPLPRVMNPTTPQAVRNLMRIIGFKFPKLR